MNNNGKLFVVSGPSGAGKDAVIARLLKKRPEICFSISTVSRQMRPGEIQGEKYNFVSRQQFEELIAGNGFLEYAEYCGNYYGTPKAPIDNWISKGLSVLVEVDVQGALKIMKMYPQASYVFIMPPSLNTLKQRLEGRATDSAQAISKRVLAAAQEIETAQRYTHIIVNRQNELDETVDLFCDIIDGKVSAETTEEKKKIIEEVLKYA